MKVFTIILSTICAVFLQISECSKWSYEGHSGPAYWFERYPWCGYSDQSPINIQQASVSSNFELRTVFTYMQPRKQQTFRLKNNGHSLQVDTLNAKTDFQISLNGVSFILEQFHFHWGKTNDVGSEHTINGHHYIAELHLVHYNTKYATIQEAMTKADGLAVIAFLFKIGESNLVVEKVLRNIQKVQNAGNSTEIPAFSLSYLVKEFKRRPYYQYKGSLTTPPCYETVHWTISTHVLTMSENQINRFRCLRDSHGEELGDNFRPVQPLYGRRVEQSG